jgi:SAM-dependent methyltransferase
MSKRYAAATARNREPILEVLRRVLPAHGTVLEIASGTGEHATYFAANLPHLVWQPSDASRDALLSVEAWRAESSPANLRAPVALDASSDAWDVDQADAVVCINMIHIAPWRACEGLMRGASRVLRPGSGVLYLYGPFMRDGVHTAPSNEAFDRDLRARDPSWGVRALEAVTAVASRNQLERVEVVAMPANNLSVVFRRLAADGDHLPSK